MDDQNNGQQPYDQSQEPMQSARQAAYERAYYEAAKDVPWASEALRSSGESGQQGQGQTSHEGAVQADASTSQASAGQDASSFVDYVSSDAFRHATQQAKADAHPQQPFVDNAYQQPWNAADSTVGQGAYSTQSSYPNGYAYQPGSGQAGGYQTVYGQPQSYTPYVASKDHVAAGLLAIFLGSLGIHKFYLGYNTAGFIMLGVTILGSLITLGIAGAVMSVIGIIEGVIYLTKNQGVFDAEYVYGRKEWF